MTLTVSPWVVWGVLSLALFGLVFLWRVARDAVRDVWEWARRDRVAPLLEDDRCGCCEDGGCHYGTDPEACGQCGHPETWHAAGLEDLPPEQSAEALGFRSEAEIFGRLEREGRFEPRAHLQAARERRMPGYEAEARQAYAALELDYPSGMLARVRELNP